jgi:hypothetical protein
LHKWEDNIKMDIKEPGYAGMGGYLFIWFRIINV